MKGRRKIAMKKRETRAQRAVSFSKRRYGLFNKAAEFCMLSGSQIAIVVSSPCSKESIYPFGYPSVDSVFDAFVNNRVPEAVDSGILKLTFSLWNEIKALKKEPKNREIIDEFLRDFENLEEDLDSVDDLLVAEEQLKKLKEKALSKLSNMASSQVFASGSTSVAGTSISGSEAGPGILNQDVKNNGSVSKLHYGTCAGLGSNQAHLGESIIQDVSLEGITKSVSNPQRFSNFDGTGKFGNNHIHYSSFSDGICNALASDYVHPSEHNMHDDGDLSAIAKSFSSRDFTGNLGNNSFYNTNVNIGFNRSASASNVVFLEANYVRNWNIIREPELAAATNSVPNFEAYFSDGICNALASDFVHPGEHNMHDDGDFRAITKSFSGPDFTGNLGSSSLYNTNVNIGFNRSDAASNVAFLEGNYVRNGNIIQEPELATTTSSVSNPEPSFNRDDIGLEYNAVLDDPENSLAMIAEYENKELSLYSSANTASMTPSDFTLFANYAEEATQP